MNKIRIIEDALSRIQEDLDKAEEDETGYAYVIPSPCYERAVGLLSFTIDTLLEDLNADK